MKATPIIIAVGILVVIVGAWVGWTLADQGARNGKTAAEAPAKKTAGTTDEGTEGKAPGDEKPRDPYLLLTGRAEDGTLDLAGKTGSWQVPPLPAKGELTWIRTWEFRGEAGKARIDATWKRAGADAVVLTDIRRADLPTIPEITVTLGAKLELSGPMPEASKERSELERMGRQLLFLLRGIPAEKLSGGGARQLGGQAFRFAPLDDTRAVLLAADLVTDERYPAEPGILSEVQLTRTADGAFAAAVRVIANRRAEVGTVNVERLELR